jgi:hypothetical protein
MAGLGTLFVAVRGDTKGLKQDLDLAKGRVSSAAMNMKKSIAGINFKAIGVAAGAMAAVTVVAMNKSIKAASDLEETASKFSVVFKGQEKEAKAWASELVDAYKMSTRESLLYLSSVQDLLVPMGMNAEAAGKMSSEVVKLSADLGSFNNLPTEKVMEDIQSALVGNFETMKKYGVVLNATNVQQKALTMGLADTKNELTAAHKAQAAYQLMVEGSSAAIGDMIRTGDSFANQQKQMTATVEDFTAAFGKQLLPVATKVLTKINKALLDNKDALFKLAKDGLVKLVQGVQGVVKVLKFFHNAWNGIKLVGQSAIVLLVTGIDQLFKGFRRLFQPLDLLFKALVKMGKIENNPFDKMQDSLNGVQETTFDVTQEILDDIDETNRKYSEWEEVVVGVRNEIEKMPTSVNLVTEAVDDASGAVTALGTSMKTVETDAPWNGIITGWDGAVIDMNEDTKTFKTEWNSAIEDMVTGTEKGSISWLEGEWAKSTDRVKASFEGALSSALIAAATGDDEALLTAWQTLWTSMATIVTDLIAKAIVQAVITSGPAQALGSAISGGVSSLTSTAAGGAGAELGGEAGVGAGITTGSLTTAAAVALPVAAIGKAVATKDVDVAKAFLINPALGSTLATLKLFASDAAISDLGLSGDQFSIGIGGSYKYDPNNENRGFDMAIESFGSLAHPVRMILLQSKASLENSLASVRAIDETSYMAMLEYFKNTGITIAGGSMSRQSENPNEVMASFLERWNQSMDLSWQMALESAGVQGFANGGFMRGGQIGIVGERGPELFMAPSDGTIVTAEQTERLGGGGTTININGVVTTDDIDAWLADRMQNMQDNDVGFNINTTDTMQAGL